MHLSISSLRLAITPAAHIYLASKIANLQQRVPQLEACALKVSAAAAGCRIEASVRMPGVDLVAVAAGSGVFAAMDELADRLGRQLTAVSERLAEALEF